MRTAFRGINRREDFARETGTAADVEDQRRGVQVEKFEGAVGHLGLDILDSGGSGVFSCFCVIVMKIWGAVVLSVSVLEG